MPLNDIGTHFGFKRKNQLKPRAGMIIAFDSNHNKFIYNCFPLSTLISDPSAKKTESGRA